MAQTTITDKVKTVRETEVNRIITDVFTQYDTDRSGALEKGEVKRLANDICTQMGAPQLSEDMVVQFIANFDENKDGKISLPELIQMLGPMLWQQILDEDYRYPYYRQFYTRADIEEHCTVDNCWVVIFNRVLDLSDLLRASKNDITCLPIIEAAGSDISHWFDRTSQEPKTKIDIKTGRKVYHHPQGRFLHVPPALPDSFEDLPIQVPWWRNPQYSIGQLTHKERPIRIINTINHNEELLVVPSEESLSQIQDRYALINVHTQSYTWKNAYGQILNMQKTLAGNGYEDDAAVYDELEVPDEQQFVPSILLYFNNDLTDL